MERFRSGIQNPLCSLSKAIMCSYYSNKKGNIKRMAVLNAGFQGTVEWVLHHGYSLLFLLMLVEGPVVTAAGAFGAALHYFNVWIILALSVLANLIPDGIYYALGYWSRGKVLEKYGHYFGITKDRIAMVEKLAAEHSGKSLLAIKLIPVLATPGLIVVGASRMDIKKYALWCTIITLPTSLLYLLLGFYFGAAYSTIEHYVNLGIYVAIVAAAVIILIVYLQRKHAARIVAFFNKK
jgi:membrane protein DedA with SNARE-associated domain